MWKTKWGKCIYQSRSGYKVYQNFLYRWLSLGSGDIQTAINRRQPHRPALNYFMPLSLLARQKPGYCCILGTGGAGVIHLINKYQPSSPLVSVDNSDEVILIAKKYFMIEQIKPLRLITSNAQTWISQTTNQFQHLIIDLYDADYFALDCKTNEFFSDCKKTLSEEGFLAVNLANLKEQWPIFQLIKKQFQHNTFIVPVKKSANIIVFASKNENKDFLINRIRETHEVKQIVRVSSWGYVGEY